MELCVSLGPVYWFKSLVFSVEAQPLRLTVFHRRCRKPRPVWNWGLSHLGGLPLSSFKFPNDLGWHGSTVSTCQRLWPHRSPSVLRPVSCCWLRCRDTAAQHSCTLASVSLLWAATAAQQPPRHWSQPPVAVSVTTDREKDEDGFKGPV